MNKHTQPRRNWALGLEQACDYLNPASGPAVGHTEPLLGARGQQRGGVVWVPSVIKQVAIKLSFNNIVDVF